MNMTMVREWGMGISAMTYGRSETIASMIMAMVMGMRITVPMVLSSNNGPLGVGGIGLIQGDDLSKYQKLLEPV